MHDEPLNIVMGNLSWLKIMQEMLFACGVVEEPLCDQTRSKIHPLSCRIQDEHNYEWLNNYLAVTLSLSSNMSNSTL
ncbi:hypothetical protein MSG28_013605 [Choristoneura fumiferana]|uniref:Uncharacterized protein n=1 Tax=Choristoneura fumiferana TaxID=7141 RepID=A0ACC0K825_CHOFU|nr:hypothetical protein MSG28_013605 [Choristoneura fumiferana]